MKKQWYAAKELIGIAGLPSSPQGINQKARREGWEQRRRLGVQGKAVEYHIDNLPILALNQLHLHEDTPEYLTSRQDPLAIWIEAYYQLTETEREQVIAFIFREGIGNLIARLDNS